MSFRPWRKERVAKRHDRKTFVAVAEHQGRTICGYYSLGPASVKYARAPEVIRRGLGRYEIGAYRLSWLAVSVELQGQGSGGQLLLAAGR
jgi:hypothetical protein